MAWPLEVGHQSAFGFTDFGRRSLQPTLQLSMPRMAFAVRSGVEPTDLTTFELLLLLRDDGWCGRVKGPARGRRGKKPPMADGEAPVDYQHDAGECNKFWWVKQGRLALSRWYLLALHLAPKHGQVVRHFDPISKYETIVTGKKPAQTRVGKRKFQFLARAEVADVGDGDQQRQQEQEEEKEDAEEAKDSDAGVEADETSDGDCGSDDGASQGGGSSSGSRSNTSASSSSSSSSSASAAPGAAASSSDPPQKLAEACTPKPGVEFGVASEITTWHDSFRFVKVYAGGVHSGWEVTCKGQHSDAGRCTRTRSFHRYGGPLNVEKLLKLWCVQARDHDLSTDHKSKTVCPDWAVDDLPDLPDIEAMMAALVRARAAASSSKRSKRSKRS